MQSILELFNIDHNYHSLDNETKALSNINFTVKEGEFLSIVGPSGCGKSTLLSLICGLSKPSCGRILFRGHALTHEDTLHIGYMLQKDHLLEWRNIRSNIRLGLEIQKNLPRITLHMRKLCLRHTVLTNLLINARQNYPAVCASVQH